MKIITGIAKGMNIETLEGEATRPTTQRVKEAVFSMIQFEIENTTVLDLFAGSGQMGLEALSRGAKRATFCDASRDATDIIIRNAKKTRLFDKCRISTCDYNQMLRGLSGKEKYDLIFIDPPYGEKIVEEVLKKLLKYDILADNCTVICESGVPDIFIGNEELKESFDVVRISKYSISYITLLKYKAEKQ